MRTAADHNHHHVLVVCFPGQGHVNPFLRLSKRLASAGLFVTFSSTVDIGRKLSDASTAVDDGGDGPCPVGDGLLRFEFFSDGWDDPADPRRNDPAASMARLKAAGSAAVADLISGGHDHPTALPPVGYVVSDPFVPWVVNVAAEAGVPCAVLWNQSCADFSTYYHYYHGLAEFPTAANPDVAAVSLPDMPTLSADELSTFLLPSSPCPPLTEAMLGQLANLSRASRVLVNSFDALEGDIVRGLSSLCPITTVGPLVEPPGGGDVAGSEVRGDLCKVEEECMGWLDAQESGTVVYTSVGSVVVLGREEAEEMARGLRGSGRPILWVVRGEAERVAALPEGTAKGEKWMVVGWSPQERVLGHPAVGCAVTHCGWNTTLECLAAGVPVVAYPHFGDQVPNAKFLNEVFKVGVHLKRRRQPGGAAAEAVSFSAEDLERCIEEVTRGPAAEEIRRNVQRWKAAAREAVAEGGSSNRNIRALVEEIRCRGAAAAASASGVAAG